MFLARGFGGRRVCTKSSGLAACYSSTFVYKPFWLGEDSSTPGPALVLVHAITIRKPLKASTPMRYELTVMVNPGPPSPKARPLPAEHTSRTEGGKYYYDISCLNAFCIWFDLMVLKKLFHIGLLDVTSVQVALTGETEPFVENDMPLPVLQIQQQEPLSLVVSRLTCT